MKNDKEKDEAAIRKWVQTFFDCMDRNDFEQFIKLMADDIVLLPPEATALYGLDSVKQLTKPWFDALNMSHNINEVEVMTDHNLAYARLEYEDNFKPIEGGEITHMDNKALWVFRREPDNTWKAIRCIWNRNPNTET